MPRTAVVVEMSEAEEFFPNKFMEAVNQTKR